MSKEIEIIRGNMPEILGSGKCKCLNKDEKKNLKKAIDNTIKLYSESMKKRTGSAIKQVQWDDFIAFQLLREKVTNTPEC